MSGLIGAIGGANTYTDSSPPPASLLAQPTPAATPSDAAVTTTAAGPLAPAIAVAPSATPAEVIASSKELPANVRYAPSSPPREIGGPANFDRSA